jgi:pyrroloquinoline quinone (PQQ) biosynthesis protein C
MSQLSADQFFTALKEQNAVHRALRHPFLQRFSQQPLTLPQIQAFAVQHYMYSRFFTRNMAMALANVPDEEARSLLILNLYEEIGEPFRMRERVHLLLLSDGLVKPEDVGAGRPVKSDRERGAWRTQEEAWSS